MTNYEKVKSMSIDELVELFIEIPCLVCDHCDEYGDCQVENFSLDTCKTTVMDWLKAESEDTQ